MPTFGAISPDPLSIIVVSVQNRGIRVIHITFVGSGLGARVRDSKGRRPGARVSAATTHDGFDNDPLTMNHILRRVLRVSGLEPVSEFTSAGLEY